MSQQSAEEKIRRTIAEINHVTDRGDFEGWVSLFAKDGCFRMFGQEHRGHGALREFISDDQPPELRGLHLTTDSVIDMEGARAVVVSNFIFIADGEDAGVVVAKGRYHDVLVPDGDRWLFKDREAVLLGPVATAKWGAKAGAAQ